MTDAVSRRALFGRLGGRSPQWRPPWAIAEPAFSDACTQCRACERACGEGIIRRGRAGYPVVDFSRGACTFCGACASACEAGCFDRAEGRPAWALKAAIADSCVETKGVTCRVCGDSCDKGAIRFRPRLGGGAVPAVDLPACTGCGACVAPCPVGAVSIALPRAGAAT